MTDTPFESQTSWLATATFAFVGLYTHLSLGTPIATMDSALYFGIGLALCKLLLDTPAQWVQRGMYKRNTEGLSGEAKQQAADKSAAVGTFIKATQVVIAFAAAKYSFPYFI